MREYKNYYNKYLPGFENAKVAATGSAMGIRETRRFVGDYVLNIDDYMKRAVFDDEIGRYAYPDRHTPVRFQGRRARKTPYGIRQALQIRKGRELRNPVQDSYAERVFKPVRCRQVRKHGPPRPRLAARHAGMFHNGPGGGNRGVHGGRLQNIRTRNRHERTTKKN